jgi:hypothetical protein
MKGLQLKNIIYFAIIFLVNLDSFSMVNQPKEIVFLSSVKELTKITLPNLDIDYFSYKCSSNFKNIKRKKYVCDIITKNEKDLVIGNLTYNISFNSRKYSDNDLSGYILSWDKIGRVKMGLNEKLTELFYGTIHFNTFAQSKFATIYAANRGVGAQAKIISKY